MARGILRIEGAKQLEKQLKALDKKVARDVLRKALRAGAKPILAAAKEKAPKDTGLLAKSLKVRAGKRRKGRVAVVVQTKEGDYKGDTFYAAFHEFGYKKLPVFRNANGRFATLTKAQHRWAKDYTTEIKPRPFMRPAFDEQKDAAIRIITDQIRRGIKEATGT